MTDSKEDLIHNRQDNDTDNRYMIRDFRIQQQPNCHSTAVEFEGDVIRITGCVIGSNGCHIPAIKQIETDNNTVQITIESREDRAPNEFCTDVIVENGYEAILTFSDELPGNVVVVHDDMNGRKIALRAEA